MTRPDEPDDLGLFSETFLYLFSWGTFRKSDQIIRFIRSELESDPIGPTKPSTTTSGDVNE